MSVLVDWEIRDCIRRHEIIIDPFDDALINPGSVDFRLGDMVSVLTAKAKKGTDAVIDPTDPSTFSFQEISLEEPYTFKPLEFIIAPMLEHVTLDPSIMAIIKGKSSLGRLGIANSDQAGLVDLGWKGQLVIELFNHGAFPIKLRKGMKIGQMMFFRCSTPDKPYGLVGRYQNQKKGQGSLGV